MIVGTAGHIDHGKTTLVRALTGVDTDRLPEEKARGISIELGFAFLPVPGSSTGERIGFVDVPGHERLVHTMISGATGIDLGLLLVAADDGPMPQTREHLSVLTLLGLSRGVVVITKIDRVDAPRIAQVRAETEALLAGTALASAPMMNVSATTGEGVAALREHLFLAALKTPPRHLHTGTEGAAFRLAIDRAFTLAGVGTVVTGTVHAGSVRVGDELTLVPSAGLRARVRSLHAQNRAVETAWVGQRCAVALVGIRKDDVARGQWLVEPEVALATDRFDASLTLWAGEGHGLRSGTAVHVHVGAADVVGSVAVLDADSFDATSAIGPGRSGRVQLVLREPIGAWRGDRVILRDAASSRTLAGGRVLDPFAPVRYRRIPERLTMLSAMALEDAALRLNRLVAASREGVCLTAWARAEGMRASAIPAASPDALCASEPGGDTWLLGATHAATLNAVVLAALASFHARDPETLGPDAGRLRRLGAPRLPGALWKALLQRLQGEGRVSVRGSFVHLPAHETRLSAADERLAQKIASVLAATTFEGHWVRDLARDARESEALMRGTLSRLAGRGELHQVVKDLFFVPAAIGRLAGIARTVADERRVVTAARFRDATGVGRKRAIQLLEYFDRIGLLRRIGEGHQLRADTLLFAEFPAQATDA